MTADERKRGLRAAVRVKMMAEAGGTVSVGHYAAIKEDLLWEVVDALVDEIDANQEGVACVPAEWKLMDIPKAELHPVETPVEYRCLWEEYIGGAGWVPFSGRVGELAGRLNELECRQADDKFRHVHIEARLKSEGAWPRPFDHDAELHPVETEGPK